MNLCEAILTCGIHLATLHSTPPDDVIGKDINSINPGIYAIHNSTGITSGLYRNSHYKPTFYLGYSAFREYPINVFIGAGTGYLSHPMFMFVPSVKWDSYRFSLIIKTLKAKTSVWGVHLSYEF